MKEPELALIVDQFMQRHHGYKASDVYDEDAEIVESVFIIASEEAKLQEAESKRARSGKR